MSGIKAFFNHSALRASILFSPGNVALRVCFRQFFFTWLDHQCRHYVVSSTVNSPLTDTLVSGQLYLRTLFSIPVFTSQSNSVFAHSRKRTRTLLKMEIGFFSLFTLSRKRTLHVLTTVNQQIYDLAEQQISGDRFSQAVRSFDMTSRKSFSCHFWLPN